ncbi:hypothetical protein IWZ00DRAFT_556129 [Phyllosticta capitalensis]
MTISTNGTCWYPDGSTVTTDAPCNTTAAANGDATACCGAEALCMANGLCYDWGILSRGSCTDSSWGEGCAQYCTTRSPTTGERVLACSVVDGDITQNTFACDGTNCSDSSDYFTVTSNSLVLARPTQLASLASVVGAEVVTTAITSTISSASSTGSATVAASATVTESCPADQREGADGAFSSGEMAGVGVGVGVPLLLAFLAALWLWRREVGRGRKGAVNGAGVQYADAGVGGGHGQQQQMMNQPQMMMMQQQQQYQQMHYLQNQQTYQEIGTEGERIELPPR